MYKLISISVYLSVYLFICLSFFIEYCFFNRLSICLSIYLFICLSISIYSQKKDFFLAKFEFEISTTTIGRFNRLIYQIVQKICYHALISEPQNHLLIKKEYSIYQYNVILSNKTKINENKTKYQILY